MVVVDSGVWIDFFRGAENPKRASLRRLLANGEMRLVIPDLVLYEVLRGFGNERAYLKAEALLTSFGVEASVGPRLAHRASTHFRALRAMGITVRSAIDVLIATFCIDRDYALLHGDRDFDAFEKLRGLRVWKR